MQDRHKSKQQLIDELASLRAQLERMENGHEDPIRSEASLIIPTGHYAMIFDQFPLGISVIRKDGFIIYVNPAFVKLTGYTLPDIDKEKKWFQKAYPDKECRRKALYSWVKYQTQQLVTEKVFQVACKDGKYKYIEFNMITVADGAVISILTDVTDCGKAEESLREREDQWRLLLDTMNEGFITVNEFGVPVFVNQRFCDLTGYMQKELIGRPVSAFLDPENLGIFQSEFSQRSYGRLSPYEIVFRHKDGRPIYFLMSPRPLYDSSGRFAGSFGTCMDITERKIMEEELRRSEQRYHDLADDYRTVVENATEGIYRSTVEGRYIMANHAFARMLGYESPDDLLSSITDIRKQLYVNSEARMDSIRKVEENGSGDFEIQVKRKDGNLIWLLNNVRVVRNDQGQIKYFEGITKDISGRKRAENALAASELKYRALFNVSPVGIVITEPSGKICEANPAWQLMSGFMEGEYRNISSANYYVDPGARRAILEQLTNHGMVRNFETRLIRRDNTQLEVLLNSDLLELDGKTVILSQTLDITERKRIEDALRNSEERYRTIAENTNDAIYVHDFEGNIIDVNDNACLMVGYERDELIGANLAKIDAGWHCPVNVDLDVLLMDNRNVFERENIRKDGSVIPVEVSVKVVGSEGKGIVNGFVRDISERKRAEMELREREERLKALANNLPGVVYQFYVRQNGDMGLYYVSGRSREILGVDNNPADFFTHASACVPLEDRSRFLESIRQAALSVHKWEYEGRFITPAGEEKYVRGISVPEERPGEVVFNGMLLDITEQKCAEDALEESRKRYQDLIESINEIIWEIDATGRFTYISPSIEKLTGYEQREVIGKLPYEFAFFEDMEKLKDRFHDSFDTHDSFDSVTGIIVHKRGGHVAVEVSGNPFYVKEGHFGGYRGILRDISEIKKLQEEMIKSQKLESIGTLAGGIAHDFNNLLMGILGYIGLAKLNAQQEMVVERSLSKAEESCLRAKELAQRLLTFSRGGDPQMKPIDIRNAVRESVQLVLSGSNIQCRYYLAKHLHPVRADAEQIRQAIGNIILNAVEASPAGGAISVKGENVAYRRKDEKPLIKVTISDRGKGISKESLKRIFDPYFTTKDMGALKGTGLGLSISYSIIKKHGGDITVQSEAGKGTSVSIYLPAYGDIRQTKSAVKEEPPVSGRSETSVKRILVMDDEALIRSFMEETMSFLGYDVTTCDEGAKAVEMYRKAMASRPYDLVVLNLTVRDGLGGQETIQRLLDVDPAVTAIICSGYNDDPVMNHCGAYGFKGALVKPASIEQIRTTLNSIFHK